MVAHASLLGQNEYGGFVALLLLWLFMHPRGSASFLTVAGAFVFR